MLNRLLVFLLYVVTIIISNLAAQEIFSTISESGNVEIGFGATFITALLAIIIFQFSSVTKPDIKNLLFLASIFVLTVVVLTIFFEITFGLLALNFSLALMFSRYFNVRDNNKSELAISQFWGFVAYSIIVFFMFINALPTLLCVVFLLIMLKVTMKAEEKVKLDVTKLKQAIRGETVYFLIGVIIISAAGMYL